MTASPGLLIVAVAVGGFAASLSLTAWLRRYAISRKLLDEVNQRSSHTLPTPRGGGMAIVVVCLAAFALALAVPAFPDRWAWGLLGGGGAIAAIGWIDDHGHVAVRWRMLTHLSAATWVVAWVGPFPLDGILPPAVSSWLAWPSSILFVGWLINLYNFMDGIDGIAGSEAVSVAGFGSLILLAAAGADPALTLPLVALAASSLGFLVWNWPPAKIFMGDAGSGFTGFALGGFVLLTGQIEPALGFAMAILLAVFVCDASVTLLRRLIDRQPLHEAHRTHAYQILARRAGRHRPVTLGVIAINAVYLLPLAGMVAQGLIGPLVGVALAYAPLAVSAWLVGAGRP